MDLGAGGCKGQCHPTSEHPTKGCNPGANIDRIGIIASQPIFSAIFVSSCYLMVSSRPDVKSKRPAKDVQINFGSKSNKKPLAA